MARYIKEGISEEASFASDMKVRKVVEDILDDIRKRGDEAVRELSVRFDNW
ncbi:MAG TPA: histidinol dehydrogenase, partial [Chloroflexi bacterium]|nr:histidinol dehydrogenase [Chloroflexota bacterium]